MDIFCGGGVGWVDSPLPTACSLFYRAVVQWLVVRLVLDRCCFSLQSGDGGGEWLVVDVLAGIGGKNVPHD